MNILITGVAGFIGSHVASDLLKMGSKVVGIDNLSSKKDLDLKLRRLGLLRKQKGFEFYKIDAKDNMDLLDPALQYRSFDAVIHMAAKSGVNYSVENPAKTLTENVIGTSEILEYCRREGIGKFILASSSCVYGEDAPLPTKETDSTDHPMQVYGVSKRSAELLAYTYHALYGMNITVLRYFTVYGPWGRPEMAVMKFIRKIDQGEPVYLFEDNGRSRGYTYISDIAEGTIKALDLEGFEIINLGGSEQVSIIWMANSIGISLKKTPIFKKVDRPLAIIRADAHATLADTSKAKELLDWEPKVGMSEGLKKTIDWYRWEYN